MKLDEAKLGKKPVPGRRSLVAAQPRPHAELPFRHEPWRMRRRSDYIVGPVFYGHLNAATLNDVWLDSLP